MPVTTEVALVAVPLAIYLYVLGHWHGGKCPRVVAGKVDLAWLCFGLGGLVAFGPLGRAVVAGIFGPTATPVAWVAWGAALVLVAAAVARTGRYRLVIYHVAPDQARAATGATLADLGGTFVETLNGFEDRERRTGVAVRSSPRMQTAVVDVQGHATGPVLAGLLPGLRARLGQVARPVSTLSTAFFAGSSLLLLAPAVAFIALDPQGRRAARAMARWLGWG